MNVSAPLIRLRSVQRNFGAGEAKVAALKNIDLSVEPGDFVAILGPSGCGKSTLLNIIGCLDQATSGDYEIAGRQVDDLSQNELAHLRREYFGFVFQNYYLLPNLTSTENIELSAVYAAVPPKTRVARANSLIDAMRLHSLKSRRPSELSGGQQQRVAVARALMNEPRVILADEPTGALDTNSSEDILHVLEELNQAHHTIILVTHDMKVAERAKRIIELRDGEIVSDHRAKPNTRVNLPQSLTSEPESTFSRVWGQLEYSLAMAMNAITRHKLRAALTTLGIVIGIAAVVSVLALGRGATQRVLDNISSLGTSTLEVFPGADFGDIRSNRVRTLTVQDAQVLAEQPYAASVTPVVTANTNVRFGSIVSRAQLVGVGEQYLDVRGFALDKGRFFNSRDVRRLAQDVVIDQRASEVLFLQAGRTPIGSIILIDKIPSRVVGVLREQSSSFSSSRDPRVFLPYTTVQGRFLGDHSLRSILLRVDDRFSMDVAQDRVTQLLTYRHGAEDFLVINQGAIRETISSTSATMSLAISIIGTISLLVGGIGVMNIMMVSVVERTAEIGLRMAVGAQRSDILWQFLVEACLLCVLGGVLGITLALVAGLGFTLADLPLRLVYSWNAFLIAITCSIVTGIVFGYLPARTATRLDPVSALRR